jgi:phosphonate transport system substrate-binding protein
VNKRILFVLFSVVVASAMILSACAAPTAAPTAAPVVTEAPVVATTVAPTLPPTPEPPTPTPPPDPICTLMANPPVAEAGKLGSPEMPIVVAFVPSGDTGKITKAGQGIADCLNKITGLSFKVEVGTSFAASIEAMGAEKAQVGFLNTFSALVANKKYPGIVPSLVNLRKYTPGGEGDPDLALKGEMEPFYKAEFFARTDANVATFADLKGKKFCFVEPGSTSGNIVPRIILKANGIDPEVDFTYQYAGSHDKVAIAVYNGDCDAGVAYTDILTDGTANLAATYPDIAEKVKIFAVSDRIPNDGVQFIASFDPAFKQAVIDGLMAMTQDPGGKFLLKSLYSINGYIAVDPDYYQPFLQVLLKAGVDPESLLPQ